MPHPPTPAARRRTALLALAAVTALLAACGGQPSAPPTPTVTLGAQTQSIAIDAPQAGAVLTSPFELRGRTTQFPAGGALSYRVLDAAGAQVGAGTLPVAGAAGQPGAFAGLASFDAPAGGAGRVEVLETSAADGSVSAVATVDVSLGGRGGVLPPTAGPTVEPTAAPTAAPLPTAVTQQAITIDTPPPGAEVGSPMTITGRTSMWPFQGRLAYRVVDPANRQLGAGSFPVSGSPGQPASFVASITFALPAAGGAIRVELSDEDSATGTVAARASIDLNVSPPAPAQQQIFIDSPPPGATVGSPMTVTGRARLYPQGGVLGFMVRGSGGAMLGGGNIPAARAADGSAVFNAAITFNLPPGGGDVTLLVGEPSPGSALIGAAELRLYVATTTTPPTAVPPPTAAPAQQQIFIETPPPGTVVGSPLVITGRTTRNVNNGRLYYTIATDTNQILADGEFPVPPSDAPSFNQQLFFDLPPQGGQITVRLFERDSGGAPSATATIQLQVAPQIQPRTAP